MLDTVRPCRARGPPSPLAIVPLVCKYTSTKCYILLLELSHLIKDYMALDIKLRITISTTTDVFYALFKR